MPCSLIEIDYDPLPAVFNVLDAVTEQSALVHEVHRPAKAFADLAHVQAGQKSNICYQFKLRLGDVDKAFAEADRVFEDQFTSPPAQHVPMEPHVTLVYLDEHERVNIWTASQSPSYVRTEVSATFGIPMHRIRVRVPYLGGGYGAKLYAKLEPLVTLLALITRKPVRYALTREEEFLTVTKHGVVTKIKTAIKNGAITARKCEVYWDTGAYAEIGPRIGHKSGYTSAGPYKIPNVWIDSYCVYTNKVPAGAFRGFGVPQVIWAYDSQTDMIARALGADPVEFRLRPMLDEGEAFATGTSVTSFGIKQAIRQAAQAIEWSKPTPAQIRHQASRQRHRRRRQGGAHAVDFRRHRDSQCRRHGQCLEQHGGNGPRVGDDDESDRRRGVGHRRRSKSISFSPTPMSRLTIPSPPAAVRLTIWAMQCAWLPPRSRRHCAMSWRQSLRSIRTIWLRARGAFTSAAWKSAA